ncbi:hypothetical protein LTR08_008330 [Meristemomyces frigidus]|nr:hypothetical protein LTR08_008330 [Meristemomyces frigidus]
MVYWAPFMSETVAPLFAGHAKVGTAVDALPVMLAIDMDTVKDMELTGPLEATTELMPDGASDTEELAGPARQEPYIGWQPVPQNPSSSPQ